MFLPGRSSKDDGNGSENVKKAILGLQPRDKAAMLDKKFSLKNLYENRV